MKLINRIFGLDAIVIAMHQRSAAVRSAAWRFWPGRGARANVCNLLHFFIWERGKSFGGFTLASTTRSAEGEVETAKRADRSNIIAKIEKMTRVVCVFVCVFVCVLECDQRLWHPARDRMQSEYKSMY